MRQRLQYFPKELEISREWNCTQNACILIQCITDKVIHSSAVQQCLKTGDSLPTTINFQWSMHHCFFQFF